MIKTDSLGNHQWSSVQGGSQNDWGYSVELTPDSGFFVAGYSNSFYTGSSFDYSPYYFRTDKNGKLLWQKSIDQVGYSSFVYGSCALPDGGFLMCGQTYATSSGNADAYLIRVDKNGNTIWTNQYGGIQDEVFNSVAVINNSIYAVGGNSSHPADTASDGWVVKLDMNGTQLQDTFIVFNAGYKEVLNGITPYSGNNFHVCGSMYINDANDTNVTHGILGKLDTSLTFLEPTQNAPSGGKNSVTSFSKVLNISYGSTCVIGIRTGGYGGLGMFFAESDKFDNFIYGSAHVAGGAKDEYGYSGLYTSSGRVIGVGNTASMGAGQEDAFLVRFDSDSILDASIGSNTIITNFKDTLFLSPVSIKSYTAGIKINLFPNPSTGYLQLQLNGFTSISYIAKAYNILGEEVFSGRVSLNNSNELNLSSLDNGTYFMKVQYEDGQNISVLKFIINK